MKIKRRTLTRIIKWAIIIVVSGSISVVLYSYFGTQLFTITSYQISGIDEVSRATINTRLHVLDQKKLLRIIPLNKILTYSTRTITSTVRDVVPEMATIDIHAVGLHTIKVEVTLLRPMFRVSNSQAVTSNRIIFSTQYPLSVYPLISIASSTTHTIKDGGIVFTQLVLPDGETGTEFFTGLSELSAKISSLIFPVYRIIIERTGDISFINEKENSTIIIQKESDPKKVWSTLVSAIDTDPLKSKLEHNKNGLEYLDARYGNKVFYRFSDMAFQNGTVNGILGSHATTTEGTSSLPQ